MVTVSFLYDNLYWNKCFLPTVQTQYLLDMRIELIGDKNMYFLHMHGWKTVNFYNSVLKTCTKIRCRNIRTFFSISSKIIANFNSRHYRKGKKKRLQLQKLILSCQGTNFRNNLLKMKTMYVNNLLLQKKKKYKFFCLMVKSAQISIFSCKNLASFVKNTNFVDEW